MPGGTLNSSGVILNERKRVKDLFGFEIQFPKRDLSEIVEVTKSSGCIETAHSCPWVRYTGKQAAIEIQSCVKRLAFRFLLL